MASASLSSTTRRTGAPLRHARPVEQLKRMRAWQRRHDLYAAQRGIVRLLACRPTVAAQSSFEKSLWNKTKAMNARQEGGELVCLGCRAPGCIASRPMIAAVPAARS